MKETNSFRFIGKLSSPRFAVAAVLAFLTASQAPAANPPAGDPPPTVDKRADEILKRMSDYLATAKFFSVKAEIWQDMDLSSGQRIQAGREVNLQVRRPNRLRAEVRSPKRNRELLFDGNAVTLFNRMDNLYGTAHVSGSLDDAMDAAVDRFGIQTPLEDFIRSNPHRDLLLKPTRGSYIGQVNVMGVPCYHLLFSQTNIDWQIWIETGPRPVPRKFVITYRDEEDSPQYTALFSNWDFTTELPDYLFKFEPPDNASRISVQDIKAENEARRAREKGGK